MRWPLLILTAANMAGLLADRLFALRASREQQPA